MSTNSQEMELELKRIKNHAFDLKGYFPQLYTQLLPTYHFQTPRISAINELYNEQTFPQVVRNEYLNLDYVLLFYAHKPHVNWTNPYFPHEPQAHTSLFLCKVGINNRITSKDMLNIDGYNNSSYISPATYPIKTKLLIVQDINSKPLQTPTWSHLDCVLYAFTFAIKIFSIFSTHKNLIEDIFVSDNTSDFHSILQQSLVGTYLTDQLTKNDIRRDEYHSSIRTELAIKVANPNLDPPSSFSTTPTSFFSPKTPPKPISPLPFFSLEKIRQINTLKEQLLKEINSCWPYPNKDRKIIKVEALKTLLSLKADDDIIATLNSIEENSAVREGRISNRTANLLDELRSQFAVTNKY